MADRTIRVTLRAEVGQYKQAMTEAAKATAEVGSQSTVATSALGRMVQSARSNREAWTTTGTALLAVGAAITGIGVAALKTGIEYNTLQQTSRAALTTLLGSAEAANAQMDKLDDFARNSPFAKQVFITAQQQMLGFGVAAEDVIPALDSIQNAVAAMGGSNDQIAAISEILSRIKSEGRLSGDALQRLGYYGIDAAALIGDEMGKTSAEIRDMAAKPGGIPVDQIWDPLVNGMNTKFGGAADNVKQTFLGAVDRVKAAWRDLSSELASGLVNPNGGGALVDWLNSMADAMRGFQNAPGWVKATTGGLVGLVGVAALLGGGALLLVPRLVALYDGLGKMGPVGIKAQAGMKGFANALPSVPKVLGVAAAVTAIAAATGELVDSLTSGVAVLGANELAAALDDVVTSGGDLSKVDAAFQNTGKVLWMSKLNADSVTEAFDQMLNPSVTDKISGFLDGVIPRTTGYMETLEERVSAVDTALTAMVSAGDIDSVNEFTDAMLGAGYTTEDINRLLPQTKDALIGVEGATGLATDATEDATAAFAAQIPTLEDLIGLQSTLAGEVLSQREAEIRLQDSIRAATEALEANGQTLDITTAAGAANRRALDDIADSGWALITSMQANGATQGELQSTMQVSRDAFLAAAAAMGMGADEAGILANQMGLIPAQVAVLVSVDTALAEQKLASIRAALKLPSVVVGVDVSRTGYYAERAYGGPVPGSSPHARADNVVIRATAGEWVHQVPAVNYWGPSFMDAVNRMDKAAVASSIAGHAYGGQVGMPAFATGGYVGAPAASSAGGQSLAGLVIEGTLDLGGGLVGVMRGVVKAEMSEAGSRARYAGGS